MRKVHLVVCDLFLPGDIAAAVCADLRLPALEKMLARGASTGSARADASGVPLENYLSELFGMPNAPIAPVSAEFDGLGGGCDTLLAKPADCGSGRQAALPAPEGSASPCQGGGCWLRADPVHLRLERDQLVLLPDVEVEASEAARLSSALNEHFAGQGMEFFAPHPQRWYIRLEQLPDIETTPLSQAVGSNVRGMLPKGKDAMHWHRIINEIQMLLFAHPVNEAREARGELAINSLWLWGGGCGINMPPQKNHDHVCSDEVLAEMLSAAAGISFSSWPEQWRDDENSGRQLLVWTSLRSALRRGDLDVWRSALQEFETGYAQPLWNALRAGKISELQMDILGGDCARSLRLARADAWTFWRNVKPLARYSMV